MNPLGIARLIISCPFGNYFAFTGATSTLGTYTVANCGGVFWRAWKVVSTVRYNRWSQSWINKLGLPNPGISSLTGPLTGSILSIYGVSIYQWEDLVRAAADLKVEAVEFNLSCPNIGKQPSLSAGVRLAIDDALAKQLKVIAKLPPVRWMDLGRPLYDMGVRCFHLCNTIPTPGGGISGKPLMQYSLWAVEDFRREFGRDVTLIGGGGVTCEADVRTYLDARVDHVAVGSMLMNPWNWRRVKMFVKTLEGVK